MTDSRTRQGAVLPPIDAPFLVGDDRPISEEWRRFFEIRTEQHGGQGGDAIKSAQQALMALQQNVGGLESRLREAESQIAVALSTAAGGALAGQLEDLRSQVQSAAQAASSAKIEAQRASQSADAAQGAIAATTAGIQAEGQIERSPAVQKAKSDAQIAQAVAQVAQDVVRLAEQVRRIESISRASIVASSPETIIAQLETQRDEVQDALGLVPGADVLAFDQGVQDIAALADPNADRVLFWDDSAGAHAYLTPGNDVAISGTTVDLAASCAFSAHITTSKANVTGNGANYIIPFDVEDYDVGGDYNTTTGLFTAPVAGYYSFTGGVEISGLTSGMTSMRLYLDLNGTVHELLYVNPYAMSHGATGQLYVNFSRDVQMSASDFARIRLVISGGASDSADILGRSWRSCYFTGRLVRPS